MSLDTIQELGPVMLDSQRHRSVRFDQAAIDNQFNGTLRTTLTRAAICVALIQSTASVAQERTALRTAVPDPLAHELKIPPDPYSATWFEVPIYMKQVVDRIRPILLEEKPVPADHDLEQYKTAYRLIQRLNKNRDDRRLRLDVANFFAVHPYEAIREPDMSVSLVRLNCYETPRRSATYLMGLSLAHAARDEFDLALDYVDAALAASPNDHRVPQFKRLRQAYASGSAMVGIWPVDEN